MYFTVASRGDGFGAQFQGIIYNIMYIETNNKKFAYNPIKSMQHNYDNDTNFLDKVEKFMNLKNNYINVASVPPRDLTYYGPTECYGAVESNFESCIQSESFKKIKRLFWVGKKSVYNNGKINIAIHIRRSNAVDVHIHDAGIRYSPNAYYLNAIRIIRTKYINDRDKLLFHIYSQGDLTDFDCYKSDDTVLHIDENLFDTFMGLVSANILVMSMSSFSYVSALLSDGEIYYKPFWHPPMKHWIVI